MSMPNSSNDVIARFFPMVMAPHPPTEWMRTAVDPAGKRFTLVPRGSDRFARPGILVEQLFLPDLQLG